jgi:hypothetical protein
MFLFVILSIYLLCMTVVFGAGLKLSRQQRVQQSQPAPQFVWTQERVNAQFRAMTAVLDVQA